MTSLMKTERHIKVEGAFNVRDLGGYETREGRRTQWRRFFRADCLDKVDGDVLASRIDGGLKTVVDLRSTREIEEEPSVYRLSTESPNYLHVDLIGDPSLMNDPAKWEQPPEPPERYLALYTTWLDDRQEPIRTVLSSFIESGAQPAMFNCHAGKDRTGVIAALLLGLAGVPDETIVADYALSGPNLWPREMVALKETRGEGYSMNDFSAEVSSARSMELTLAYLNKHYGDIPTYLTKIGLSSDELDRLRKALLD
jgi:protein-tyrosine phosphatase